MSKFNRTVKRPNLVTNDAGGQAYQLSPKQELVSHLLTSFVIDKAYKSEKEANNRLLEIIGQVDPMFAAKAAIYARDKFGMRSVSHIVAGEIPHLVKEKEWVRQFIKKVVIRADDITEIMSYQLGKYGRKAIPNSLKRGLADSYRKFDEHQLTKYRGNTKAVTLRQTAHLVHPTGGEESPVYKLRGGLLKNANTWETRIAATGTKENKQEAKQEAWGDLINKREIGYFALLKNLRNIKNDAPEHLNEALKLLTDKKLIQKSRVLPFRYMTAYDNVGNISMKNGHTGTNDDKSIARMTDVSIVRALNKAMEISCSNVPKFDGKVLICIDDSGSMSWPDSSKSNYEKASQIAAILLKANPYAKVVLFGNGVKTLDNLNPDDSLTTIVGILRKSYRSGCTDFSDLVKSFNEKHDVIIVLSDMQGWVNGGAPKQAWSKYCKNFGKPNLFAFDVSGNGTSMFPESQVFCISGFSDQAFLMMKKLMEDKDAMIKEIERIKL